MNQRNRLLCAYTHFNITAPRWKEYWAKESHRDPFQEKGIFPLRSSTKKLPRCWAEALEQKAPLLGEELCILDEAFPERLAESLYAPAVLYIEGAPLPPARGLVSIVGTRNPSSFGYTNALSVAEGIAAHGFGIVSGLARGIDSLAHQACLDQGAYTMAVMGTGLGLTYPKENRELRERILKNGGSIVSQFPDSTPAYPANFPNRNVLIATLSAGTIVVEGGEESGAIITGKLAMEHNLTCLTLLQDYRTFGGKGAIQLLDNTAIPMRNIAHALQAIAQAWDGILLPLHGKKSIGGSNEEEPMQIDDYARKYQLTPLEAVIEIERLLLNGRLERLPNQSYRWKMEKRKQQ